MKRFFWFLPLLLLLILVPGVSAQNQKEKKVEVTEVESGETINRNYFAANESVKIEGTVNGDAFIAGGTVTIDGTINGDLLVAGGMVTISGKISDDVRVAGGTVRISGAIGKSLTVAGGTVDVADEASIGGSVVALGGNIDLDAPVTGTINAGVGNLTISNTVGGDVEVGVGTLRLTSGAVINGKLTYWSDAEASIDNDARVTGGISRQTPPQRPSEMDAKAVFGVLSAIAFITKIINLLTWFFIGLLVLHFLPKLFTLSVNNIKTKPWASLGIGFLVIVSLPILAITLMLLIIGIPTGMMLFALWFVVLYLAKIPAIYFLGEWVMARFDRPEHKVWTLLVGLLIYGVLTLIPVLGWFIGVFATLFGLGAWLLAKKDIYTEARSKNII